MPSLRGARVALLEARLSGELSALIERSGGVPCPAPAVREVPRLDQVPAFLNELCAGRFSLVVFLTGVGVKTLFREAERLGRLEETVNALRTTVIACRGPKPVAALTSHRVSVQIKAVSPYTTTELLDALSGVRVAGRDVALLHYGERNQTLADALIAREARLEELCLYEWQMPLDCGPLTALLGDLIEGHVTVIAFTSQIQCRHLFQLAEEQGKSEDLLRTLRDSTIVAAIGPVCAATLRGHGITPDVLPAQPKMGPLVAALADYIELADVSPEDLRALKPSRSIG
jgi:uroporphyrinogen-III synthase